VANFVIACQYLRKNCLVLIFMFVPIVIKKNQCFLIYFFLASSEQNAAAGINLKKQLSNYIS